MSKGRCLGNSKSCQQSPFHIIMLLDNCKEKLQSLLASVMLLFCFCLFVCFYLKEIYGSMCKVTKDDK